MNNPHIQSRIKYRKRAAKRAAAKPCLPGIITRPGSLARDEAIEADLRRFRDDEPLERFARGLDPEYLAKIKHDCIVLANARLPGASPEDVVREAAEHLVGRLRFLMGAS